MRFADSATKLCGQCAMLLGWRPGEFWQTTPAELACIIEAASPQGAPPLDVGHVAELMEMFPDG
ncbi:MAG: phage tail assembly chaperone [Sphingomonadaceae bacterium]|nr:phage tail assembly chaperone [Sphingomonadaceae bacterium]